jgi:pimeloyl-ACP methyl ester carboxylesterase
MAQALPYPGWTAGADLDYLKELVGYWASGFDWRAQERRLNAFPQFTADIDGQVVHFVHQRGRGPSPLPLVLTHGWPSSFVELLSLVPLLTDPAAHGGDARDSFDVVIPSLPGYAFSPAPRQPGACTAGAWADLWARLMTQVLGYRRFGAQGQDIGAAVAISLGASIQTSSSGSTCRACSPSRPGTSPCRRRGRPSWRGRSASGTSRGAYAHQQATYPLTLAYGLTDSPVGLAVWIVEKFRTWSDCAGEVERRFTKDELLTNITIYWVTGTIGSSFLFYYDRQHELERRPPVRVGVPVGVALFPKQNPVTGPREWADQAYNITRWTEMPRGGHFPAAEEPELLAEEIQAFFRPLR